MFNTACSIILKVLTSTGVVAYVTEETWDPKTNEWIPTKWSSEYSPTKLVRQDPKNEVEAPRVKPAKNNPTGAQ